MIFGIIFGFKLQNNKKSFNDEKIRILPTAKQLCGFFNHSKLSHKYIFYITINFIIVFIFNLEHLDGFHSVSVKNNSLQIYP